MKRRLFLSVILIFTLFCSLANAQEDEGGVRFSADFFSGVYYGQLDEIVYEKNFDKPLLSLLEWEIKPLVTIGVESTVEFNYLYLKALCEYGLYNNGVMKDSDWFQHTDIKQCYSISDEKTTNFLMAAGYFGGAPYSNEVFSINLNLGFEYDYFYFDCPAGGVVWVDPDYRYSPPGNDGKIISWDSDEAVKSTTARINYDRKEFYIWTSVGIKYIPANFYTLSFDFSVAPFTFEYSIDHHYNSGEYYLDINSGFFKTFKIEMSNVFTVNNMFVFTIGIDALYMNTIHGETRSSSQPLFSIYPDKNYYSGASKWQFHTTVGFGVLF